MLNQRLGSTDKRVDVRDKRLKKGWKVMKITVSGGDPPLAAYKQSPLRITETPLKRWNLQLPRGVFQTIDKRLFILLRPFLKDG